jgi:hypothetical protein
MAITINLPANTLADTVETVANGETLSWRNNDYIWDLLRREAANTVVEVAHLDMGGREIGREPYVGSIPYLHRYGSPSAARREFSARRRAGDMTRPAPRAV